MNIPAGWIILIVALLSAAGLGGAAGYWIGSGHAPVAENMQYRPTVRLDGGAVIAERAPEAKPKPPPHKIPSDHVEERRVSATVEPERPGPVSIDLSLVRDPEGGRRAIVSSPDGPVVAALDVPILPGLVPAPVRRNAAGIAADPFNLDGISGVWATRDYGRLRAGAVLFQQHGDVGGLALLGLTF